MSNTTEIDDGMIAIHASDRTGHRTLCGLLCAPMNPAEIIEPPVVATPGQYVTCLDCRAVIDHVHKHRSGRSYQQRNT